MDLVLLPGRNVSNKAWIHDIALSLRNSADSISIHHYEHWKDTNSDIAVVEELKKLSETVSGKKEYVLVGKSLGVGLVLEFLKKKPKTLPRACVFIGTSLENDFTLYDIPTLFIQNEQDSVGSFEKLAKKLKNEGVKNQVVIKMPGEGHSYPDVETLSREIARFLSEKNTLKGTRKRLFQR